MNLNQRISKLSGLAEKGIVRDYFIIILGSFVMASGISVFLVEACVVSGGVSGLSMAIYYLSGDRIPVGFMMWLFNIPLFIWRVRELGKQFGARTFVGFTASSFFVDLLRGSMPGLHSIMLVRRSSFPQKPRRSAESLPRTSAVAPQHWKPGACIRIRNGKYSILF